MFKTLLTLDRNDLKKVNRDIAFDCVFYTILTLFLAFMFFLTNFWLATVQVVNVSMNDTLYEGNVLFLDRLQKVDRFDVIVFKHSETEDYIKRVIGLPGDTVYTINYEVYVNGEKIEEDYVRPCDKPGIYNGKKITRVLSTLEDVAPITMGDNEYFVMGDNREHSADSREFGPISGDLIKGVVLEWSIEHTDELTKIFDKK